MSTFTTAISAAQLVYDSTEADQTTVDNAKTVLETAANTFNGYKQLGTKIGGEQEAAYDVYIAGSYSNGGNSLPCYWENGIKIDLPLGGEWIRGWAEKIVVNAGDIYILGTADNGARSVGCYWKNGVITLLSYDGYPSDIAVSNGDVYVVGSYTSTYDNIPCYWKNGIKTDLAIIQNAVGNLDGHAYAIYIYGDIIYIAGRYGISHPQEDTVIISCYWQNGARIALDDKPNYRVEDIFVNGNDVYLTGDTHVAPAQPWLYKNGVFSILPSGTNGSRGVGIAISNDDVYVVGYVYNDPYQAVFWKNGVLNTLPDGSNGKDSFAHSIAIVDGDVFIAGAVDVFYDFQGEGSTSTACYWKNGVKTNLLDNGSANGIAVVSKND
jgi:hypothetical protein